MAQLKLITVLAVIWLAAPSVFAHHPFDDEFDRSQSVTLTGTLTRLDWQNPHVYAYIDVKDAQGKAVNWKVEMGSPSALTKQGWTRTSLKTGDEVTIQGWKAKGGMSLVNAESFQLPDGKKMTAASSFRMAEGQTARADESQPERGQDQQTQQNRQNGQNQFGFEENQRGAVTAPQRGDRQIGTTGAEPEALPATASPLALLGLLGALGLGGALGVRALRR